MAQQTQSGDSIEQKLNDDQRAVLNAMILSRGSDEEKQGRVAVEEAEAGEMGLFIKFGDRKEQFTVDEAYEFSQQFGQAAYDGGWLKNPIRETIVMIETMAAYLDGEIPTTEKYHEELKRRTEDATGFVRGGLWTLRFQSVEDGESDA